MILYLFKFLFYCVFYIGIDYSLGERLKGKYYLIHSLNNLYVMYLTYNDLYVSYADLYNYNIYPKNIDATIITFSLHFYHLVYYFDKLRFNDWLHHILMIVFALPLSMVVNGGCLVGHSLFFTTGLPGCIDYFMLFLVRNKWMKRINEKKYNNYINLWIRSPGCTSHAVLTTIIMLNNKDNLTILEKLSGMLSSLLVYWNGIYFMNQVVVNYSEVRNRLKN